MSSTSQVKTVLGERAFDYLRICLDAGQSLIEEQASLPLESGCLWSCLPADFTGAQSADPRWSLQGVITDDESKGKADILVAEFILHYLQDGQGRYAIFQDWKATPNTGVLVGWMDHYFTFGSEVYHIIQSTDAALNMESILNVMHRGYLANPRLNVGILTTANDLSAIMPGQEITPDMMRTLSQGVEHIIVDGFDGDREIIWSKRVIVDK